MKTRPILLALTCATLGLFVGGYFFPREIALRPRAPSWPAAQRGAERAQAKDAGSPAATQQRLEEMMRGKWEAFTGSADEFLEHAFLMAGSEDTMVFLQRSIAEASPEQLGRWMEELGNMPQSRPHHPEALRHVLRRLTALDPGRVETFARGLTGPSRGPAMAAWLGGLVRVDAERALSLLGELPAENRGSAAFQMAEFLKISSPEKAIALMQKHNKDGDYGMVGSMLGDVASVDPQKALTLAAGLRGQEKASALENIYRCWANSDPRAALAAAQALEDPAAKKRACDSALQGWTSRDPKAALAYLQGLPADAPERASLAKSIGTLVQQDPRGARALVEGMTGQERRQGLSAAAAGIAAQSLDEGLSWLEQAANPADRRAILQGLGNGAAIGTEEEAIALLAKFSGQDRVTMMRQIASKHTYSNPELVAKLAEQYPGSVDVNNSSLFYYLGRKDLKAGVKLALQEGGERSLQNLFSNGSIDAAEAGEILGEYGDQLLTQDKTRIISQIAQSDPAAALAQLPQLADPAARSEALATIIGTWASNDPDAALAYAKSLSGADCVKGQSQALNTRARQDPATALATARAEGWDTNPATTKEWVNLVSNAVSGYTMQDPREAAQFIQTLPVDERDGHYGNLAQNWVRQDTMAASAWIRELPSGGGRDSAVQALVREIANTDPASAYVWQKQLPPPQQQYMSETVFKNWLRRDRPSAAAAIQASGLSPEKQEQLLKQ